MKKAQATIIIAVASTIVLLIIFGVVAYEEKLGEGEVDTKGIEASINRCITQSAKSIFIEFGNNGTIGQEQLMINNEKFPIYVATPSKDDLANYFSYAISNLTKICIAKINFVPMNALLLNNPESINVIFFYDDVAQRVNVSLNTTLVFGIGNRKTIKLTNLSSTQYPLDFKRYVDVMTRMHNQVYSDLNYYLPNDCPNYNINGKSNISIMPLNSKYTYFELVDSLPTKDNFMDKFVWREVIEVSSSNIGKCANR